MRIQPDKVKLVAVLPDTSQEFVQRGFVVTDNTFINHQRSYRFFRSHAGELFAGKIKTCIA